MMAASDQLTTKASPLFPSGVMHVGLAVTPPLFPSRVMLCTSAWWNGELLAVVGWGLLGKADPEDIEFPLVLPPLPAGRPPAAPAAGGCGDVSCGGALTAQILTVPSAAPETSKILSGGP